MPDEPNTTQNPTPTENSIPASPSSVAEGYGGTQQEPMADAPILPNVSDATATRYLSTLEKEGKIK